MWRCWNATSKETFAMLERIGVVPALSSRLNAGFWSLRKKITVRDWKMINVAWFYFYVPSVVVLYGVLFLFLLCSYKICWVWSCLQWFKTDDDPGGFWQLPESSFPSSPAVKLFDSKFLFRADLITFAALRVLWASSVPSVHPSLMLKSSLLIQALCVCGQRGSDPGGSEAAGWSHKLWGLRGPEGAAVSSGRHHEFLHSLHPLQTVLVNNSSQKGTAAPWNTGMSCTGPAVLLSKLTMWKRGARTIALGPAARAPEPTEQVNSRASSTSLPDPSCPPKLPLIPSTCKPRQAVTGIVPEKHNLRRNGMQRCCWS